MAKRFNVHGAGVTGALIGHEKHARGAERQGAHAFIDHARAAGPTGVIAAPGRDNRAPLHAPASGQIGADAARYLNALEQGRHLPPAEPGRLQQAI